MYTIPYTVFVSLTSSAPRRTLFTCPTTLWCIVKDQDRIGMERSCWGILTGRWGCGPAASCAPASGSGSWLVDEARRGLRSLQRMNRKDLRQTHWKMTWGGWRDESQQRGHWGQVGWASEQVEMAGQQGALLGQWQQAALDHFLCQGWSMGWSGSQHLQGGGGSEPALVWGNQCSADRETELSPQPPPAGSITQPWRRQWRNNHSTQAQHFKSHTYIQAHSTQNTLWAAANEIWQDNYGAGGIHSESYISILEVLLKQNPA